MRPIFEQRAFGQVLAEPLRVIVAQAAPEHQIRTARDHADGVDLQHAHAPDGLYHIIFHRFAPRRLQHALRCQVQGAGASEG